MLQVSRQAGKQASKQAGDTKSQSYHKKKKQKKKNTNNSPDFLFELAVLLRFRTLVLVFGAVADFTSMSITSSVLSSGNSSWLSDERLVLSRPRELGKVALLSFSRPASIESLSFENKALCKASSTRSSLGDLPAVRRDCEETKPYCHKIIWRIEMHDTYLLTKC